MAPKDMPGDVADVGRKNVSNKDVMPDAGKIKLGMFVFVLLLSGFLEVRGSHQRH